MPEKIETAMFAPCGMNCMVCYKHCYHKKPCDGCLKSDQGKPQHCRKCKIKDCITDKKLSYCYECSSYPCKQIKALEKSYNTRYRASLMENSKTVTQQGLSAFLEQQRAAYTCPLCGGIISIHDGECSECQHKITGNEESEGDHRVKKNMEENRRGAYIESLIGMLEDKDTSEAYKALQELEQISDETGLIYRDIGKFIDMISSDKYVIRVRGFRLFCRQARWDRDFIIDENIDTALNILKDGKPTACLL